MRIFMTADTVGGVFSYATDLLGSLGGAGTDACLVTMGPAPAPDQIQQIRAAGVKEHHHLLGSLEWMEDPWADLEKTGRRLRDLVSRFSPDIIHFNHFAHVDMEWPCPVLVVAHSCVISWYQAVHGHAPGHLRPYHDLVRSNLQRADRVVAPSEAILREFIRLHGPFKKALYIHNSVSGIPRRHTPKRPVVFSMGRLWDEAKNMDTLLEAALRIEGEVHIAGERPQGMRLPHNVTCLGRLSRREVLQRLSSAMIYALPVRYEPFGLSFLEAALNGCALIGGDIPTLREIWGDSMVHVKPMDAAALAAACNALLTNEALRQEMSGRATRRALQYEPRFQTQKYVTLYHELLAERPERKYQYPSLA